MVAADRCHNDNTKLRRAVHREKLVVSGRTFTSDIQGLSCPTCGETIVPMTPLLEVERAAAVEIARTGPVDGESFRFMRKVSGIKAADLATLLNVRPATVSAWETKGPVDRAAWMVLAQLVVEKFKGKASMHERLERIAKGKQPRKRVRFEAA
jgi:DNA-binding XRE family transcriptional regulator